MPDKLEDMDAAALRDEIVRLNKIITALMDRAEQGSIRTSACSRRRSCSKTG